MAENVEEIMRVRAIDGGMGAAWATDVIPDGAAEEEED